MIVRDTVAIKSVGIYFKKKGVELLTLKKVIEMQKKELEEQFKGDDFTKIIFKLEESINKLNYFIDNLNYFGEFMITLSEHDKEVIEKTKKNLLNIGGKNE